MKIRIVVALCSCSVAARAQQPPREWVEPTTGHRVVRLSDEAGSASLYFHQNPYTASGDKLVFTTKNGISTVNLKTRNIEQVVEGRTSHLVVGPKSRTVYYMKDGTVYATHLDTKATRAIATKPELRSGSGLTVNADETLLAGSYMTGPAPQPPANTQPQAAGSPAQAPSLEERWARRLP